MDEALVIEPHAPDAAALREHLGAAGLRVRVESTAAAALAGALAVGRAGELAASPAVVVTELVLPDLDGLTLLRALRGAGDVRAAVVVTREARLAAKLAALDAGADDYVVKPCAWPEVVARVRAVLRRAGGAADGGASAAPPGTGLTVDPRARCARRDGVEVRLRPKEYALLHTLWAHRGQVLTRDELLRTVWGYAAGTTTRTVDTHVAALRRRLEPRPRAPRYIVTVTGAGYRLVA